MNAPANIAAASLRPAYNSAGISTYIYFIRSGIGGPVKIGVSRDPRKRLRQLQTGSAAQLLLVAAVPGGYADEAVIHSMLACDRIHGEHFHATPRVLGLAANILRAHAAALAGRWPGDADTARPALFVTPFHAALHTPGAQDNHA